MIDRTLLGDGHQCAFWTNMLLYSNGLVLQ